MSLIHDALKKAESEKRDPQAGRPIVSSPVIAGESSKKPPARVIILGAFLAAAIGLLLYLRLLREPASVPVPAPKTDFSQLTDSRLQDPPKMKEEGTRLYRENKLEEARRIFEALTLLVPTDEAVYNNLGLVFKKMGKTSESKQSYQKALALNEKYPEALNNLGVLYLEDGLLDMAKSHFERAIRARTDYAPAYLHLALVYEREGQTMQAGQKYQEFLDLSGELDPTLKNKIIDKIRTLTQP